MMLRHHIWAKPSLAGNESETTILAHISGFLILGPRPSANARRQLISRKSRKNPKNKFETEGEI
jgi:hypothetical protein